MTKHEYDSIAVGLRKGFRFEDTFVTIAIQQGFTKAEAKEAVRQYGQPEDEFDGGWTSEYEADAERRDREG